MLRAETADPCLEPYLRLALAAASLWSPADERAELAALVADACRDLAEAPARRQVAMRGLAGTAGLEEVTGLLARDEDDIDLRWRCCAAWPSSAATSTRPRSARLVDRDPDPESWVRALAVRAATPTAEDKEAVWQALTVERSVPISSVGEVATAFWAPGHVELLRPYAERYLELLPHLHAGGMIPAMVYSGRLFPPYGIDAAFISRAKEVASTTAPVVRRRLGERAEEVRRMLVARSL